MLNIFQKRPVGNLTHTSEYDLLLYSRWHCLLMGEQVMGSKQTHDLIHLSLNASLPEPCLVLLEHHGDHLQLPLCQLILGWHLLSLSVAR
jgi:hypothetical protein